MRADSGWSSYPPAAKTALAGRGVRLEAESHLRETPPEGGAADLPFLNGAWLVSTEPEPPASLATLLAVETEHGRVRREKWGNRTLDLDVLLWSGGVHVGADPIVPHPRLLEREFALGPTAEVAPEWEYPGTGRRLRELGHRP